MLSVVACGFVYPVIIFSVFFFFSFFKCIDEIWYGQFHIVLHGAKVVFFFNSREHFPLMWLFSGCFVSKCRVFLSPSFVFVSFRFDFGHSEIFSSDGNLKRSSPSPVYEYMINLVLFFFPSGNLHVIL